MAHEKISPTIGLIIGGQHLKFRKGIVKMENQKNKGRRKGTKNNPAKLNMGMFVQMLIKSDLAEGVTKRDIEKTIQGLTLIIHKYLKSQICPKDVEIPISNLGKFTFKIKKGLKAGSTYQIPSHFGNGKDENGNHVFKTVTIEEDRPDYRRVWFEVSPTLQEEIRELSEQGWYKDDGR